MYVGLVDFKQTLTKSKSIPSNSGQLSEGPGGPWGPAGPEAPGKPR